MSPLVLHGYWRSTASYRVRIALNLKGVAYDQIPHDLRRAEHRSEAYRAVAPQGLVPALSGEEGILTQSLAILEWLEERFPEPPLLPKSPTDRALVRSMAALVACDIHPLNNLRVLEVLRADFEASAAQIEAWIARWIVEGFAALETLVERHGGAFAFGETPTMADCLLAPQVYSARRFNVDLGPFPHLMAVDEHARTLPAFASAHPDAQPDTDR